MTQGRTRLSLPEVFLLRAKLDTSSVFLLSILLRFLKKAFVDRGDCGQQGPT